MNISNSPSSVSYQQLKSPRAYRKVSVPQNDDSVFRHFSIVHKHENGRTKINVSGSGDSVITFSEESNKTSVQIEQPLLKQNRRQIPSDFGNRRINLQSPFAYRPSLPGIFSDAAEFCRTRPCLVIGSIIGTIACVVVLYPIISVVTLMLECSSSHSENTKQVTFKLFC